MHWRTWLAARPRKRGPSSWPGSLPDSEAISAGSGSNPKTWRLRNSHAPILRVDPIAEGACLQINRETLDRHVLGQGRDEVQTRNEARAEIGAMRHDAHADSCASAMMRRISLMPPILVTLGCATSSAPSSNAAGSRTIRRRSRRPRSQRRPRAPPRAPHGPPAATPVLPASADRSGAVARTMASASDAPRTIGVDHQGNIRRRARRARPSRLRHRDLVQLDMPVALLERARAASRDRVGPRAAQQARIGGKRARDVPPSRR